MSFSSNIHGQKFKNNKKKFLRIKQKDYISKNQPEVVDNLKSKNYSEVEKNYKNLGNKINNVFLPTIFKDLVREGYKPLIKKQNENTEEVEKLQDKYDDAIQKWETAINKKIDDDSNTEGINKYKNVAVEDTLKNKYFITSDGIKRKFINDYAWDNKAQGCPSSISDSITNEELSKLPLGKPMQPLIPCKKGGYNIKYNGKKAWVSSDGTVHEYSDWINRHSSCRDKSMEDISGKDRLWSFYELNKGKDFGPSDICDLTNTSADNNVFNKNAEVMDLTKELRDKINKQIDIKNKLNKRMTTLKEGFREGLYSSTSFNSECGDNVDCHIRARQRALTIKKNKIKDVREKVNTYNGKIENQNLSVSSVQMHHLIWMVLGGTFLYTAIINLKS